MDKGISNLIGVWERGISNPIRPLRYGTTQLTDGKGGGNLRLVHSNSTSGGFHSVSYDAGQKENI